MRVKITPSQIAGTLSIPASKSMAHRAIIWPKTPARLPTLPSLKISKQPLPAWKL